MFCPTWNDLNQHNWSIQIVFVLCNQIHVQALELHICVLVGWVPDWRGHMQWDTCYHLVAIHTSNTPTFKLILMSPLPNKNSTIQSQCKCQWQEMQTGISWDITVGIFWLTKISPMMWFQSSLSDKELWNQGYFCFLSEFFLISYQE